MCLVSFWHRPLCYFAHLTLELWARLISLAKEFRISGGNFKVNEFISVKKPIIDWSPPGLHRTVTKCDKHEFMLSVSHFDEVIGRFGESIFLQNFYFEAWVPLCGARGLFGTKEKVASVAWRSAIFNSYKVVFLWFVLNFVKMTMEEWE